MTEEEPLFEGRQGCSIWKMHNSDKGEEHGLCFEEDKKELGWQAIVSHMRWEEHTLSCHMAAL